MAVKKHYLKDYKAPDYRIDEMTLSVDIDPKRTSVRAHFKVLRNENAEKDAPLILYGEGFKCTRFSCNGQVRDVSEGGDQGNELILNDIEDGSFFEVETELNPSESTDLTGLYAVGDRLFTQCEPHGFRRITYGLDRPDVLTKFTVTMKANRKRFPHLLCNGVIQQEGIEGDNHWIRWHDPMPKPTYLFAMVAGRFDVLEDEAVTPEGRHVALYAYVEPGRKHQAAFALSAVKRAMDFDATYYGRSYDLDRYSLVVADDFNQGAMENTGLNIFNSKYVLCDPEITTDEAKILIDNVVAHEYFHHWTGNRVTLRNWFQLSLKEGLTVYRDQSYTATQFGHLRARLSQVKSLKMRQFKEDSGPMAHPVLPKSYVVMDNFYTATVYEKGAEVIGMAAMMLGPQRYRDAMDDYFKRFTGQAVTVEDLLSCFQAAAPEINFVQFRRWYDQAGTPHVHLRWQYDAASQTLTIQAKQSRQDKAPLAKDHAWIIPIKITILAKNGDVIRPQSQLNLDKQGAFVLLLDQPEQTFMLNDISKPPQVLSFFQNFSAPVTLDDGYHPKDLLFLMRYDQDPYTRYDVACRLKIALIDDQAAGRLNTQSGKEKLSVFNDLMQSIMLDEEMDAYLKGCLLSPLSIDYLVQVCQGDYTLDVLDEANTTIQLNGFKSVEKDMLRLYHHGRKKAVGEPTDAINTRYLNNIILCLLLRINPKQHAALALEQLREADLMTDRLGALNALTLVPNIHQQQALDWFYHRYQAEPLALDHWFALQGRSPHNNPIARIERLMKHKAFDWRKPNTVRALIGSFVHYNILHFHRPDGAGYSLFAKILNHLDPINGKLAAQLAKVFHDARFFDCSRQIQMIDLINSLLNQKDLSVDLREVLDSGLSGVNKD
jgi:aminopeptidase N